MSWLGHTVCMQFRTRIDCKLTCDTHWFDCFFKYDTCILWHQEHVKSCKHCFSVPRYKESIYAVSSWELKAVSWQRSLEICHSLLAQKVFYETRIELWKTFSMLHILNRHYLYFNNHFLKFGIHQSNYFDFVTQTFKALALNRKYWFLRSLRFLTFLLSKIW